MNTNETLLPFQRIQEEISSYLRDPTHHPIPDHVDPKGIAHYTKLLFNNLNEILSNSFPVLYSVLEYNQWVALVKDFFKKHNSMSPFFYDIPKEFLDYLNAERKNNNDPDFLKELAHYEWVELALEISEKEISHQNINPKGDLLKQASVISPLAWVLQYQYPVHQIGKNFIPTEDDKESTRLIVYRDKKDEVGFMLINPITALLLEKIHVHPELTGQQVLEQMAEETKHPNGAVMVQGGLEILEKLRKADIILGTRQMQVK